jgi:DNA-binding transcriptional LysR family regulator
VAAVPDRHVLSGRKQIPIAALAETPLILLPRTTNPAFYDAVVSACRSAEIAPRMVDTGESMVEHALLLVASGLGIALLPASVAERYRTTGVSFRPLAPPAPVTELGLVARADPGEVAVAAFLRIARDLDAAGRDLAAALGVLDPVQDLPLSA